MSSAKINLAGSELGPVRHVCAFFNSKEEEYNTLIPFLKEGLENGDKAFHIVDKRGHDEHLDTLLNSGIDLKASTKKNQFEVKPWEEAYLRDGNFKQERMLELIEQVLTKGKSEGFPLTRLWANMEWALEDREGVEQIVEYETRLNYILPKYQDPVICTYDLAKFGGDIVLDILRTHPMVIIGGILQKNPFFVPPDQFLRELKEQPRSYCA